MKQNKQIDHEKSDIETAANKKALVLAGGGMAGIAYELGALHAIDQALVDFTVNDFDIYVGTSAGATLSALLANGFSPGMILQAVEGNHKKTRPFLRKDLWRLNIGRFFQAGKRVPRRLWRAGKRYLNDLHDSGLFGSLWVLLDLLPSALYDSGGVEAYLRDLITQLNGRNEFSELEKELHIIATRLDSGERVVFNHMCNVPISEAVAASSAVPALYKPVRLNGVDYMDGGVRGNASIDLAVERGATTVICINPIVPFDGHDSPPSMQVMVNQSMRTRIHAGLHYHMKHLATVYPDVAIYLIEPVHDDEAMSAPNLMRYGGRLKIAQHAYETVSYQLAQDFAEWTAVWQRYNVAVPLEMPDMDAASLAKAWPPAVTDRRIQAEP